MPQTLPLDARAPVDEPDISLVGRRALVLIGGDDVYEDLVGVGRVLQDLLSAQGFATELRMGTACLLERPARKLIVLETAMADFTRERVQALLDDIEEGAGLLVVHASNVVPTQGEAPVAPYDGLTELVGSRYGSHGPVPHESRYELLFDVDHELTAGVDPVLVEHEHYRLVTSPDIRVLAWRETPEGPEPILHVRHHGAGRVCYLQLGHDTRTLDDPTVRTLLARAARWLTAPARGEVA